MITQQLSLVICNGNTCSHLQIVWRHVLGLNFALNMQYLHINEIRLEHRRHSCLQVVKAGLRAIARHFNQPWKTNTWLIMIFLFSHGALWTVNRKINHHLLGVNIHQYVSTVWKSWKRFYTKQFTQKLANLRVSWDSIILTVQCNGNINIALW